MKDILTVLWKEGIEFLHMRGSARSTFLTMIFPLLILGILFPLQFGRHWVASPASLIVWIWIPFILTSSMIADSIAGEKERHTLETLLASRLPDRAILFGKLLASMLYALGLTFLMILIGLVTVNIAFFQDGLIWFDSRYFIAGAALGVLGTGLVSTSGILVSLKARTVRQAQQTLSFGIVIIAVLPSLFFTVLPVHLRKRLFSALNTLDGELVLFSVLIALLVIDGLLLTAATRRFTRNRLMTE